MTGHYFNSDTYQFLNELASNNVRSWFNDNKQRYEDLVRTPALQFIQDIAVQLPDLSPHFRAIPKKSGGSLMRVYRDTRFTNNKSPFKTNIGINFRHVAAKDVHAPGYFVHIEPQKSFLGLGIWRPDSPTLKKIRQCIDENPRAWLAAKNDRKFNNVFKMAGDKLSNSPRGYAKDHPLLEDLKRKDFIAICELDDEVVISGDLLKLTVSNFATASALMRYLCYAVSLPFD